MTNEKNSAPQEAQAHDENKLIAERRSKLDAIREKGNAFPNDFKPANKSQELQNQFGEKTKEELEALNHIVSVAGRVMAKRGPSFLHPLRAKCFELLHCFRGQFQAFVRITRELQVNRGLN